MIDLALPWPPSVNTYWRHPSSGALAGRHLISAAGRKYRALVHSKTAALGVKPAVGRLAISILASPPDRRRRDLDNVLKSLLDSLVHAGVVEDDELFDVICIARAAPAAPGEVRVRIAQTESIQPFF